MGVSIFSGKRASRVLQMPGPVWMIRTSYGSGCVVRASSTICFSSSVATIIVVFCGKSARALMIACLTSSL